MFWLDERVKHNTTTTKLEPLPRDPSTNKSYVLIKNEDVGAADSGSSAVVAESTAMLREVR